MGVTTPTLTTTEPRVVIDWRPGGDLAFLRDREWLATNGLGGYASGTVLGMNTRRYHGLFMPNLPAPRGRVLLIEKLEEDLVLGDRSFGLSMTEYADFSAEGDAARYLKEFRLEWRFPVWVYEVEGHVLEKSLVMVWGQNTICARYRLLRGGPVELHLRPWVTCREHEADLATPSEWPFTLVVTNGHYEVHAHEGAPPLRMCVRPDCSFVTERRRRNNVLYRVERDRGYQHVAEAPSPGYFTARLEEGGEATLVASTEPWEVLEFDGSAPFEAERQRRERLLEMAPPQARRGMASQLVLAADQFIILPGSRIEEEVLARAAGDQARTVIAGYHWFTDWGRDTMISLEGLTLCTGRHQEAGAILRTFSHYVKDGLIPNLFPEGDRCGLYHTVDATLWFFHALDRYLQYTGDVATLKMLYPVLQSIIEHHVKGTHFDIGMDPKDGLIHAAAEGLQLTWMDAKVNGWVVTPRRGKPVEIQALWHNALRLMATWCDELGEDDSRGRYEELAATVHDSFNRRYWYEGNPGNGHATGGGYLYDVIDGPDGADASLRPNQVFSVSLRFPVLAEHLWQPMLDVVSRELLTPFGLRTLARSHKDYHCHYEGDLWARDSAYHQGLVWPWLLGHYIDAWRKANPGRRNGWHFLEAFEEHLRDAGIGTISEIFDAEEPWRPRACIAQAWSVAEVLRSYVANPPIDEGP